MRQFRIKTRWGITSVSFGLIYHFPDLHHIHENSAETLGSKYSIVNVLKNTKIWSFLCQYHSLAQRWTLLLKSHVFGIIRKLDVNKYIFSYSFNQTSTMTCELFSQSLFLIDVRWPMLAADWLFTSRCFVPNLSLSLLDCFKSVSILYC